MTAKHVIGCLTLLITLFTFWWLVFGFIMLYNVADMIFHLNINFRFSFAESAFWFITFLILSQFLVTLTEKYKKWWNE